MTDLRYAARNLLKSPGFTLIAVLTLALGIGAKTAMFSVIDAAFLKPMPIPDADSVVRIEIAGQRPTQAFVYFSRGGFHTWPAFARSRAFTSVGAYVTGEMSLRGAGRLRVAAVTPAFFDVMGVRPIMGRFFTAEDVTRSRHIAVISHRLWQTRLGGTPDVLAQSIVLNRETFLVLGVLPQGVDVPNASDVWLPSSWDGAVIGGGPPFPIVIARLAQGISSVQALDEVMRTPSVRFDRGAILDDTTSRGRVGTRIVSLRTALVGDHAFILLFIGTGALLVLVVACINLANLMFTRVSARQRDLAVRRALGASDFDLARQVFSESLLLALAAGIATLCLSYWTLDAVRALVPTTLYGASTISIDGRALAATITFSALAAVVFSAGPVWSIRNRSSVQALRVSSVATEDVVWRRFRSALTVAEVAVAVVLLAGAVTVVRMVAHLMSVDLGVTGERALVLQLELPHDAYRTPERSQQYFEELESTLKTIPGVEEVAVASALPGLVTSYDGAELLLYGEPIPKGRNYIGRGVSVSPTYFSAMGIDVIAGRSFTTGDHFFSQKVAIVSESFVHRFNLRPDQIVGQAAVLDHRNVTIVGVVRDVRHGGPEQDFDAAAYVPMGQRLSGGPRHVIVKALDDPRTLAAAVRAAGARVDPNVPFYNIQTFDEIRENYLSDRRFVMGMMSGFGALAFVLAALGLYGVISYLVQLRTREIGVRMALGASTWAVRMDVLTAGLKHSLAGILIGVFTAVTLSSVLGSSVHRFGQLDGFTLLCASVGILAIAAVAAWVPAHRATRIDPIQALRFE